MELCYLLGILLLIFRFTILRDLFLLFILINVNSLYTAT